MKFFKDLKDKHANELVLFAIFLILFVTMSIMSPDVFFSWANIQNMLFQMPEFGLMALAMMIVILTGGMNLSIVTGSTLSAILAALFMSSAYGSSHPLLATVLGVIIIIGFSMLTGVLNGWLVGFVGVVAMLVTLGTRMIFEGFGLVITKGNSISGLPQQFLDLSSVQLGPIPLNTIIYIVMIIFCYYLFERSKWGKEVYMIGDNETATRFSGINTKKVVMMVYVVSGLLYGISGVLISSRYCSAKTDYGSSYLMNSVTAVVMGGTDINGGSGSVAGTVLSVLILQTITTGFTVFRVDQNIVNIFTGVILIVVLAIRYITGIIIDQRKIKARMAAAAEK